MPLSLALAGPALDGWLYLARPFLTGLVLLFAYAMWRADRQSSREGGWQGAARSPQPKAGNSPGAVGPESERLPVRRRRARERRGIGLAALALFPQAAALAAADPHLATARTVFIGAALITGLFLAAHLVLVLADHRGDELILPIPMLLMGLACVEIYRLHPELGARQVAWLAVSVAAMLAWLLVVRDYRRLEDFKYGMLAGALLLQVATMVAGTEVNGARLWIRVGGLSMQPVELVKLLLVGFLAAYLKQNRLFLTLPLRGEERRLLVRYLVPLVLMAAAAECVFVVQRDLGQGLLFFGVFLTLFYVTTRRVGLVSVSVAAFAGMSWLCYHAFGHVRVRFAAWLDPWQSPNDWGYQMVQALYALASGGWLGSGVWRGMPWRIPEAHTDYIFVSVVEELGTVASSALLLCLALLVVRAFRTARAARDAFGALLAAGIGAVLGCQTFVIVAGTTKMAPMTGITLPFMSYGGSSLLVNFLMLGLLLQISQRGRAGPSAAADPLPARSPSLDGSLRHAAGFYPLLLLSPVIWLALFRLGPGSGLATAAANPRAHEDLRARGGIRDDRGEPLARSVGSGAPWDEAGGILRRHYISGPAFGPLIGYRSAVLGRAGLERSQDATLRGTVAPANLLEAAGLAVGGDNRGSDLVLTIDARLQEHAYAALGGRRGAVVILDPRSGAVRAMVSSPGFDSNDVVRQWARLSRDPQAPLLNRPLAGTYPPGSVIKPLVVAEALDARAITGPQTWYCPGWIDVDGHRLHDFASEAHGTVDVAAAVAKSCNVALAHIGLAMGPERFLEGLRRAGWTDPPQPGLPAAAGNLPDLRTVTPEALAQMAFGQGALTVTPLQVAMITSGIAHGGVEMAPRLIAATRRPDGRTAEVRPRVWRTICSAESARQVAAMMEGVVEHGTGTAAQLPGVRVAGKTGTAENPHGATHAWFAAFAPASAPQVVVVVLVENGGVGGTVAAPIARTLLPEALRVAAGGN